MRSVLWCALASVALVVAGARAQEKPPAPAGEPTAAPEPSAGAPLGLIRTSRLRGVSARVAALMMSGQQGGSIPISALAVPVAATDRMRVFFVADIEGTNLLAGQEAPTLQVEVCVYAITAQGSVGGAQAQAFTLDLNRAVDMLSRGSIKLLGSLDLPPGAYSVRVLVRNVQVGSFGITEVPGVTPSAEGTFAFLSRLLVGEPAAAWVLAREAGDEDRAGALPHPFRFLPTASLPSTRPVLASGGDASVWVLARGAAPGANTLPVRVVGREGKEIARLEATVLERGDSGLAGATVMRLRLPVPALEPGPYLLELKAVAMTPDIQLTSSTPVVVADRKTAQAQPLWVQFGTPRAGDDEEAPRRAAFAGKAGRVKASAKLTAEYRSALERIRSEPEPAVLEAVSELESASLPSGGAAEWETLVASEKQVARELASTRPASILALAYLHGELYREYMQRKTYLLAAHARRMTEELAVLYADKAGKEARPVVADVLAVLAGGMQQPGMLGAAERLFRRALQLDPTNRVSLMGLAAGLEHVGQYRLAAGFLSQLLDVESTNAEARLRLGVNLERLGKDGKGVDLLRACVGEGNPRWVRVVAYQEMAGELIRAGRFEQAHHLLTEAVAKLPGDEALTVALVYVLDRLRRPLDARAVVRRLQPEVEGASDTPRFRYSQWPTDDLERSRRTVTEAGRRALQALREALATRDTAGGGS